MKQHESLKTLFTAGICIAVAAAASADVTVNGQNIRNDFGEFPGPWAMAGATDQSGLSANYTSGVTDFDTFVASTLAGSAAPNNTWFGEDGAPLPGNIDFDLGAEWLVTQVAMWSFVENDVNVLDGFEVFVDDNPAFTSPTFAGSFVFVGGTFNGAAQSFDITDVMGRYVRLRLTTQDSTLVGMGEFVFAGSDGSYHLSLSGACPGRVTVQWSGGTPNSQHAIIFGNNLGSFTIPNNQPCAGTVLAITGQIQLVDPPGIFSNQGGSGSISGNAGTAACGHYLQLVEGGSCQTSNAAQIP